MIRLLLVVLFTGCLIAGGILVAGCSDDGTVTTARSSYTVDNPIEDYFPLDEGYQTLFQVSYSNGSSELVTYEVGEVVPFGSLVAHEWHYSSNSGTEATAYLVPTSRSLFFYENTRTSPEQILSLPLQTGETWPRYGESIYGDIDNTDTVWSDWGNYLDDKYGNDAGDNGAVSKSYPTQGGIDMTVVGTEAVDVGGSLTFSHAVRVTNSGSINRENHYWYVQGIGLVKYVIGASEGDPHSGEVVAELVEFNR
jgi:hypothetical protein